MSKVPMKRIFIAGLKKDRKKILETLQRTGVVEVLTEKCEDDALKTMNVMNEAVSFSKNSVLADQALSVLDMYAPDTDKSIFSSLEGAKDISIARYEEESLNRDIYLEKANEILKLDKQIAEDRASIPKAESRLETLVPWMNFDLPLDFSGTEKTSAWIGTVNGQMSMEDLYAAFVNEEAKRPESLDISIISQSKEMTCIFVICLKEDKELCEDGLKRLNFAKAQLSALIPKEESEAIRNEIKELNADIEKCIEKIRTYSPEREHLKFVSDYYSMRSDKYSILDKLPQSEYAFFVDGYVPSRYAEALKNKLESSFDIAVELKEPEESEDVPVELSNGILAEPMETVVESYSLPNKNEIDPSKILAVFYYVFFGMMLSDAGYGLLMVLGTGFILLKVKNLKPQMKKMMKLFFYCGISTTVWGFMFGSFFGDAVNVIATTFFNRPDIALKPIWFEPVSEPMRLLVFAFGLGIVHLFTGLFIKLYLLCRQGLYKDAFFDVVLWLMFVGGGIVYLLTIPMITDMLGLSIKLGTPWQTASAAIAIIGAVGIVLTGGRESKNWFKRLLKGAYSAYGVTSYLSDILSYSRLLALGLATGVIAQVFNKMGSMLGASWYGILIFVIVFLIGHVMNLAINVLGAYVHTNRLQFVEFFGKFYEGGGKQFEPFTEHTKYFKVKEDN